MTRIPQDVVVPAYPFHGALLWLFQRSHGRPKTASQPEAAYFENVFPAGVRRLTNRAVGVASLFDAICLAEEPVVLPDLQSYSVGPMYFHRDLRIGMVADFSDGIVDDPDALILGIMEEPAVELAFLRHAELFPDAPSRYLFLRQLQRQIVLAHSQAAVLLGNAVFYEFYRLTIDYFAHWYFLTSAGDIAARVAGNSDLGVLALEFDVQDIDTLAAVRMNKEIRRHGQRWSQLISASKEEIRDRLLDEIRHAMSVDTIASRVRRLNESLGSFTTWLGLIPLAGLASVILAPVAAVFDVSSRISGKIEKSAQWWSVRFKDEGRRGSNAHCARIRQEGSASAALRLGIYASRGKTAKDRLRRISAKESPMAPQRRALFAAFPSALRSAHRASFRGARPRKPEGMFKAKCRRVRTIAISQRQPWRSTHSGTRRAVG